MASTYSVLAVALLATSDPAQNPVQVPRQGPAAVIRVTAALIDGDMQVRPVPLYSLWVIGPANDSMGVRTAVDGTVQIRVSRGQSYQIRSAAPAAFQGKQYRWSVSTGVIADSIWDIALTNDNAEVVSGAETMTSNIDPVATLFLRLQRSVFRIQAGLGHGTGFLADTLGGIILTNAHVVDGVDPLDISVLLDSALRVRSEVIAIDQEADVAVLRIHPAHLEGRLRLPLQAPKDRPAIVVGERLAAMGFPLSQDLSITTGIASSIRAGAVISDVNINPGNSGGPLLNFQGEVVAINTFGEQERGGPGISGSILVSKAAPALAQAQAVLSRDAPPAGDSLPVLPGSRLQLGTLKAIADTADVRRYKDFGGLDVAGFELRVQTPLQTFVATKLFENEVAKDRKKREALAGVPESQRYSELREYRDWLEYVGQLTTPIVAFSVTPKIGETGGSVFARIMLGPNLKATYKFKGDVRGVQVFRNQQPVEPILGGHTPTKVYVDNQWVSLKDVADEGFYAFLPDLFRPHDDGSPPSIVIAIRDLKNPKKLKCRELPNDVVAQAWNDFETHFGETIGAAVVRSEARLAKGRKRPWQLGFLKQECDWEGYY